MRYRAHAKINLTLDIQGREDDGYHLVQTVLQEISLCDEIEIEKIEGESEGDFMVRFGGDEANTIDPLNNTVMAAIDVIGENWDFDHSYRIVVHKRIPVGAGLGGGSSDAAAVIKAFNELEKFKLTNDELREIAAQVGTDVPFFIEGETALGIHHGENLKLLPPLSNIPAWQKLHKILVVPNLRQNTKDMYAKVQLEKTNKNASQTAALLKALEEKDLEALLQNMHNDFELFESMGFDELKEGLMENNAEQVLLCGSGTCVIAFSNNPFDLKALSQALPHQHILDLNQ
ncbi:4-(cytidine 5'-diphospho)-2-C-methyl-D-erythritol kinase [Patescibacteria group bacterium]